MSPRRTWVKSLILGFLFTVQLSVAFAQPSLCSMVCNDVEETSAASEYDLVLTSSDSELAQYIKKLRQMPEKSTRIIEISERYVTKSYRDDEIDDMKQAVDRATSIGVRTPTIRRIVRRDDVLECVQDRVDGRNLMEE